jgi:hypothetical protein
MLERTVLGVASVASVALIVVGLRQWNERRSVARRLGSPAPLWASLGERPDGHRTVAAFSTPSCAAFGVLTLPSTAILGSAGSLVALNQGFAPTPKLIERLQHA